MSVIPCILHDRGVVIYSDSDNEEAEERGLEPRSLLSKPPFIIKPQRGETCSFPGSGGFCMYFWQVRVLGIHEGSGRLTEEGPERGGRMHQIIPAEFYPGLARAPAFLHVIKLNDVISPLLSPKQIDIRCCFARTTLEECKASVPLRSRLLGPSRSINCSHPHHAAPKAVCNHKGTVWTIPVVKQLKCSSSRPCPGGRCHA